jgi:arylsulfatase A-like enzyme
MSRRLIALAAALFVLAGLGSEVPPAAGQVTPEPERPNIVFILTDDQRWDTIRGVMPIVESELLARGIEFENAFATNPLCCPSRASILTGLYAHSHGVWDNENGPQGGFIALDDSSTIATWLQDAGYHTGLVGKYLNGYDVTGGAYVPPGWDEWYTLMQGDYYGYTVSDNGEPKSIAAVYSTDQFAWEATQFIEDAPEDQPFFLMFNPRAPHGPYTPATRHNGAFEDLSLHRPPNWMEEDLSDKPRWLRRLDEVWDFEINLYDRERIDALESLLAVDEAVGRLLDTLEATGRLENTLIVYMSDNGYGWGEHRVWGKNVPYDASLRLPMIMRWDAVIPAGSSTSRVVGNIDVAPTLAAVAGAVPASPVDGVSLLRFLTDPGATLRRRGILLEHALGGKIVPSYCGFRTADELYVRYANGDEEYYQYSRDPYELRNKALARSAQAAVTRYRKITRDLCRPLPPAMAM